MSIGPDTKLFLSMSATPGRFGATVYNTLFSELGIDAVYLPRTSPPHARQIIEVMETLDVHGCSVSSPHKSAVLPLLDTVDDAAREAGAVNTIYHDADGRRVGACTDIDGVIGSLGDRRPVNAVVYGSGGVVGPAIVALRRLGVGSIGVVSRNDAACRSLRDRFAVDSGPEGPIDLLINATPDGRDGPPSAPLAALMDRCGTLLDMPVLPHDSGTISHARACGVDVVTGVDMCVAQITAQARLYIGNVIDVERIARIVREDYLGA